MTIRGAPARAGRIKQDVTPRAVRKGDLLARPGTGHGLDQIEGEEVGAQGGEPGPARLVAEHETRAADKLREQARFTAGACAHVEHGLARRGRKRQRREHGRAILNVHQPPEGGLTPPEGERFRHKTARQGRERFRLKGKAFRGEQRFHKGRLLRGADKTEGTAR